MAEVQFDQWGIVEILGHKRFAGHITEQSIAGAALVRVDVPACTVGGTEYPEFSKLIGVASIYCITPTTEEIARKAARALAAESSPLPVYIPQERQLAAASAATAGEVDLWADRDDGDTDGGEDPDERDGAGF